MGILDDAIKEHLELKRQHGAAEAELKQLEDEAFGAAERPGDAESAPDPLAEAPTEFMEQEAPAGDEAPEARAEAEAPPPAESEAAGRPEPRTEIADLQEPPVEAEPAPEPPAEEESPALEHEAVVEPDEPVPEPEPQTGPSTEEREAIAEQPTEMYDVEGEIAASQPRTPALDPDEEDEEDDDFWSEQRLSEELDQALEAPVDFDEDEPAQVEEERLEPEQAGEAGAAEPEDERADEPEAHSRRDEDVLEETPDFLEEAPEDDQLWFEQKPPKDFDFDD